MQRPQASASAAGVGPARTRRRRSRDQPVGEGGEVARARACRPGSRRGSGWLAQAAPLPVSTRCGWQPTPAPACRSRSESPTTARRAGRRRSARRSARTGPAAACGSRSRRRPRAGRRRSRRCGRRTRPARLCILAWIALSGRCRTGRAPMPDWLVATTTCQPAWFRRAIASSAPGIGMPLVRRLDELVAVVVDGAVAVEDDRASCASPCSCRQLATGRRRGSSRRAASASSAEAVGAQVGVLGLHHHVVEEGVDRRAQRGQRLQRAGVVAARRTARRPAARRRASRRTARFSAASCSSARVDVRVGAARPSSGCCRCACWRRPAPALRAARRRRARRPGARTTSSRRCGRSASTASTSLRACSPARAAGRAGGRR